MDMNEYARRAEALRGRLYRTALMYLGSSAAAADALDEAIYRGLRGCRRLRREAYFDTWLTRILINTCCDERKRRGRELPYETLPETAAETFDTLPLQEAVGRLPRELKELVILRYFSGYTLQEAVGRLPRELKELVILRYFSGYTLREAAEILEIPQGTAATRQRRALALLRLELGEEDQI